MSWWPSSAGAAPIYATKRNPLLRTDAPQLRIVADTLGTPLIPWQDYVGEVAGERRADASLEYQIVIVSVPRQTGKTTLVRAVGTHRCLVCGRDFFYTAQTGKDARERWMDLVKVLRLNDALKDRITISLRGGSEQVAFEDGGAFRVFAPTPESLHGYTPPTVALDEAFALGAEAGELLMGAIGPAQITIRDKQIWIISTAGTAESTFLHDWIERAMGGMARVALFLWGACEDPDCDCDPYTAEGVEAFHPGIGFELNGKVLTAADVLEQIDRNTRAEYERAYANRRTPTTSNLIPAETWRALGPTDVRPFEPPASTEDAVVTYDVAADRQSAAIVATWTNDAGEIQAMPVRVEAGVGWLVDAVDQLDTEWRPAAIAAVGNGPVLDITAELVDRGVKVEQLGEREFAAACGAVLSLIDNAGIRHDGSPVLQESVTGLVTRGAVADGVAFSRRHSVGNSAPAIALTAGVWVAQRRSTGATPLVYFG